MNDIKLNKKIVIVAAIITILPLNIIIRKSDNMNDILIYLPMIIGYTFYFIQYKKYSNKQRKLLNIAICISIVNFFAGLWTQSVNNIHINSFTDISFDMFIAPILFYISDYAHRVVSLILCINILKNNISKIKKFIIIAIVIAGLIILPRIFNPYNYSIIKGEKLFGNDYCRGEHHKTEFIRNIPWECKICGHSTDVINPNKNIPIICFSCSLSTGRCMECGLLQKD